MMIEALVLVHVWGLIVAGIAWILQRDRGRRIGARFPSSNVWLILISLCLLPSIFYIMPFGTTISIPDIEALEFIPSQTIENSDTGLIAFNYFYIYLLVGLLLVARTLWQWFLLQRLPLTQTPEQDVFTTTSKVPPLTLSWPRSAIVIPHKMQGEAAVIQHERAHLAHRDAEVTLCLLLLQDLMLRSPGVSYLVRQWRLAIELRADQLATASLTKPERKDYAALLLNGLRSSEENDETLPCPTAKLNSSRGREIKIRLAGIVDERPDAPIRGWKTTLATTTVGASLLGLVGASAYGNARTLETYDERIEYFTLNSSNLPASCPGLAQEDLLAELKETTIDGQLVSRHVMSLGVVIIRHEVLGKEQSKKLQVAYSTNSCFEAEAEAVVAQWANEPQVSEIRNAAVKVHFAISGDTREELDAQLASFLQ